MSNQQGLQNTAEWLAFGSFTLLHAVVMDGAAAVAVGSRGMGRCGVQFQLDSFLEQVRLFNFVCDGCFFNQF